MTIVARELVNLVIRARGVDPISRNLSFFFKLCTYNLRHEGSIRQIILHAFDDGSGADKCMHVSYVHVTCTVGISGFRS